MANPNIVNVTTITGHLSVVNNVGTSNSTLITNASSSGKLAKIYSINVSNTTTSNVGVYVVVTRGGTEYSIAHNVTVPANSTVVVVTKDNGVYLNEGDTCNVRASTGSSLDVTCSYELIS